MDDAAVQRELARFDTSLPIEAASTPPASWYRSPELLAREKDAVFGHSWQFELQELMTSM